MRICNKCGVEKPVTEFYSRKRDGIFHVCKKCERESHEYKKVENPKPRGRKPSDPSGRTPKAVCDIIKQHHEEMKDDPEHLSTEFLQKLIKVDCGFPSRLGEGIVVPEAPVGSGSENLRKEEGDHQ
jgi:hypothetical protein